MTEFVVQEKNMVVYHSTSEEIVEKIFFMKGK